MAGILSSKTYTKGGLAISSAILIRLGGLLAIAGGLAATILGLLYVLHAWGMTLEFTAMALLKGHYENPVATMLLIGVLAAIATLHFVQRRNYGRWGALTSVAALAGAFMVAVGNPVGELVPTMASVAIMLLIVGVLVASLGIVVLGIVTITARVLSWWCGTALIAGSPPGVGTLFLFSLHL